MLPRLPIVLFALLTSCIGGCASYEIDATAGYSRLLAEAPQGAEAFLEDANGVRVAANASRSFFTPGFLRGPGGNGPRGNVNLSYSGFVRDLDGEQVGAPVTTVAEGDASYEAVALQVGPSFRLSLAGFFVEPGITGGGVFGGADADFRTLSGGNFDDSETEFSWIFRPYVRAGFVGDRFLLGLEGGYERSGLDPGVGPGDADEAWYVSVLLGLRLTR
jgi:hypothetical protein